MSKQTFVVTINGQQHTRTSARAYTHAVVGRYDQAAASRRAYNPSPADLKTWEENHAWAVRQQAKHPVRPPEGLLSEATGWQTATQWDENQRWASLTPAEFEAQCRRQEIARYEENVVKGSYAFSVLQWSQSEKNAQSGARTYSNRGCYRDVQVHPVGVVLILQEPTLP